jgi:pyridoxal phosphate enzyme (YggS family)
MEKSIRKNVLDVRSRVAAAAERSGRDPGSVMLLAATKNREPWEIIEAVEAGVTVVGENRVQELLSKKAAVGDMVEWHFIGHLQKNKVRLLVGQVSLVHSVDSVPLAIEIDGRARLSGAVLPMLLQVNVAGEETKSGFKPEEIQEAIAEIGRLANIRVGGLSTIAPLDADPERVRWVFHELRNLSGEMERQGLAESGELSMGMTNDFEVAVEEGSTIVRIGSAIFDRD